MTELQGGGARGRGARGNLIKLLGGVQHRPPLKRGLGLLIHCRSLVRLDRGESRPQRRVWPCIERDSVRLPGVGDHAKSSVGEAAHCSCEINTSDRTFRANFEGS